MKKIIIIFVMFLICGCANNNQKVKIDSIDNDINYIISNPSNVYNTIGKGYKYYKPRDFSILNDNDYNVTLINEGNKYFLSIDINAYYNKYHEKNDDLKDYFYKTDFEMNDKNGYLEITKTNNNYFYIKMLYNYSYIEVSVEEHNINDAIISSAIILSSINYNDKVIETIITKNKLNSKESIYELKKPKETKEQKNILDVYKYDSYEQ